MNKILVTLTAAGLLAIAPASQAVTINLTAAILRDQHTDVLADGSTLMLIASTADSDFGDLTSLTLASPLSFVNEADDVILARFALDSNIVGVPGAHQQAIYFNLGHLGIGPNDPLLFVWYSGLMENTNPTAPGYARWFGTFGFPDDPSWTVPGDNSATIFLSFQTEEGEGPWPNSHGIADQITVIPEPTTSAMVGLGMLGLLVCRFRKQA